METVVLLKTASVGFAILGGVVSLRARSVPAAGPDDSDRYKRRWYLASYALTSVSILFFAAAGFV